MYTPSPELTALLIRDLYESRTIGRTELLDLREQIGTKLARMVATWADRHRHGIVVSPWLSSGGMFEHRFNSYLRERLRLVEQHDGALGDLRDSFDILREEMREYLRHFQWRGAWGRLELLDCEIIMRTLPLMVIAPDAPLAEVVE